MHAKIHEEIEHFLSQDVCGFRKALSTQHVLFKILQRWLSELDS